MSEAIVNLENCAREPIHIPGSIQPFGLLFCLREPELTILQVSENVEDLLGIMPEDLLGQELSSFLDAEQVQKVRDALKLVDPRESNPVDLRYRTRDGERWLDGFVHRNDGFSFLEMEPAALEQNARFLEFYKTISRLTATLHDAKGLTDLLQEAASAFREMTGFDRVMIYRFAPSHEGEVVAEAVAEGVVPYLGLWYPASDIPEQARRMYVLNPVRMIVDASYTPSYIVPTLNPDSGRPLDMSYAGLRSVSPVHLEYLRNMGVAASGSVSILRDGMLWGLVSCHHFTPKLVPYEVRKACTFMGQVLSTEIARREMEGEAAYQTKANMTQSKFIESMTRSVIPLLGLVNASPTLLDLIPSEGAAVVIGDRAEMLGSTPDYTDIMRIVSYLRHDGVDNTFVTNSLGNHFPLTEGMRQTASGMIALEVSRDPVEYVFFFRPEVSRTVSWGGNPEKPVLASDDGYRLSPRKSFEVWKEEVKGQSQRWTKTEARVAADLRNLIAVVAYANASSSASTKGD